MMSQVKNATGQFYDDVYWRRWSTEWTTILGGNHDYSGWVRDRWWRSVRCLTASCYTAYLDAKKRLAEKVRFRRFWQLSKTKGKNKGFKGKTIKNVGEGYGANPRKNLANRIIIMNSTYIGDVDEVSHWTSQRWTKVRQQRRHQQLRQIRSLGHLSESPRSTIWLWWRRTSMPCRWNSWTLPRSIFKALMPLVKSKPSFVFLMAKNQERGLGKEDKSRVNLSYQRVMNN